jgi:hypothetical protein
MGGNNNPTGKGGFKPGISPNPGGRPKKAIANLAREARKYTGECIETLADVMRNSPRPRDRMAAANSLLDRGHGRPEQNISVDVALRRAVEDKNPAEQLRILRDMRANWVQHLSSGPVIDLEPEPEAEPVEVE